MVKQIKSQLDILCNLPEFGRPPHDNMPDTPNYFKNPHYYRQLL